jgi:DNA-binding transcriptional LysR family regulator
LEGEILLRQAQQILDLHDQTLRCFDVEAEQMLVIGSTEHAAAQLLPDLAASLTNAIRGCRVRFRIDRGTRLREGLAGGRLDLALLLGPLDDPLAQTVGALELAWYSAPGWVPPALGEPIPLVAFDDPCVIRSRALETLASHGMPAEVSCESSQLAGVQAAVRAGLGIGLMATLGQRRDGLVARDDLPAPKPIALSVLARRGLPPGLADGAAHSLSRLLTGPGSQLPDPSLLVTTGV